MSQHDHNAYAKEGQIRQIGVTCRYCDRSEFTINVGFGCFARISFNEVDNQTTRFEILQERPGVEDIWVADIWCPLCGNCGGCYFTKKLSTPVGIKGVDIR